MKNIIYRYGMTILAVLTVIIACIAQPAFRSGGNIENIFRTLPIIIAVTLGEGLCLLSGGADLSMGRVMGLTACIFASLIQSKEAVDRFFMGGKPWNFIVAILICIVVSAVIGFVNGFLISWLHIPAFIQTLGMQMVIFGISSMYMNPQAHNNVTVISNLEPGFTGFISRGGSYIILALILVGLFGLFYKTKYGDEKPEIITYVLSATLAGIAGILLAASNNGAAANYGQYYEIRALSACVIGGVALRGGRGNYFGMILGAVVYLLLENALTVLGASGNAVYFMLGLVLMAGTVFSMLEEKEKEKVKENIYGH